MALALSLENEDKPDQAIKIYEGVVAKDKRHTPACHRLAILYQKKGDFDAAGKYYQEALKNSPKDAEVQCDYGYYCYLRRDWKTAEASLRKALELSPALARGWVKSETYIPVIPNWGSGSDHRPIVAAFATGN